MTISFRRVVTGHDSQGRAVIVEDGPPPRVFYEIWNTRETPAHRSRKR